MTLLKIILLIVGLAFLTFGYLIYIKKQYHLINGFESALKAGRKTAADADKVGRVELILGGVCLLGRIYLMVFK